LHKFYWNFVILEVFDVSNFFQFSNLKVELKGCYKTFCLFKKIEGWRFLFLFLKVESSCSCFCSLNAHFCFWRLKFCGLCFMKCLFAYIKFKKFEKIFQFFKKFIYKVWLTMMKDLWRVKCFWWKLSCGFYFCV